MAAIVIEPHARPRRPPTRRTLGKLAVAAIAIALLWRQAAQVPSTIRALALAKWAWLPVILLLSAASHLMGAISLRGASPEALPLGRTFAAQVAGAFTNRLAPAGIGGMATNVRFLESSGVPRPNAVTAVALSSLAGLAVHVAATAAVLPTLHAFAPLPALHGHWFVRPWHALAVAAVITVALVICLGAVLPSAQARARGRAVLIGLADTVRNPRRTSELVIGSVGVTACYALALVASLQAVGGGVSPLRVVAVYLGASALAAAAPTPGGLGAMEAALVAGLAAAGGSAHTALAAVLVFRGATYWLPVLPGWVAFRSLRARGAL